MSIDWEAARRAFARGFAYGGNDPAQIAAYEDAERQRNALAARESEREADQAFQRSQTDTAYQRQRWEDRHNEGRADSQRREDILLKLNEALAARGHKPAQLPEGYSEELFAPEDATSSFLRKTPDYNDPRVQALLKGKMGLETEAAGNEAGARAKATFPYEHNLRAMKTGSERMTPEEREAASRAAAKGSMLGQLDALGEGAGKPLAATAAVDDAARLLASRGVDPSAAEDLLIQLRSPDPNVSEAARLKIAGYLRGGMKSQAPASDPLSRMTE